MMTSRVLPTGIYVRAPLPMIRIVRESGEEQKLETDLALRRWILSTGEKGCTGKISLHRKKPAFAEPASNAEDPAYNRVNCRRSVSALVAHANREPEAFLTRHGSSSSFARSSFRSRKVSGSALMRSHVGHGLRRSSASKSDSAGAPCRRTLCAVRTKNGLRGCDVRARVSLRERDTGRCVSNLLIQGCVCALSAR